MERGTPSWGGQKPNCLPQCVKSIQPEKSFVARKNSYRASGTVLTGPTWRKNEGGRGSKIHYPIWGRKGGVVIGKEGGSEDVNS